MYHTLTDDGPMSDSVAALPQQGYQAYHGCCACVRTWMCEVCHQTHRQCEMYEIRPRVMEYMSGMAVGLCVWQCEMARITLTGSASKSDSAAAFPFTAHCCMYVRARRHQGATAAWAEGGMSESARRIRKYSTCVRVHTRTHSHTVFSSAPKAQAPVPEHRDTTLPFNALWTQGLCSCVCNAEKKKRCVTSSSLLVCLTEASQGTKTKEHAHCRIQSTDSANTHLCAPKVVQLSA